MNLPFGNKKAIAFVWLGIIAIIIIMGLFYIMLDQPIKKIKNLTLNNITGSEYESTYHKINTIWENFLLIFLFGILCFGVLIALKRSKYE